MSNNSSQDPWGRPNQNGQQPGNNPNSDDSKPDSNGSNRPQNSPPDLEEVFSNLLKKLGGKGSSNKNNNHQGSPLNLSKLLPIALVCGAIIWGLTGFYTIKEAERGVVIRFGELNSIKQPGLNWKPTFIDQVIPVNVEQVKELKTQGSMLTQDENMVKVEMTVQYRVVDPAKYLFNTTNADDSLNQATDSALRFIIGHMSMDDILTTGRSVVRENTWQTLNSIIQPYDMGLEVLDVNFQSARPPEEVKDAFDDAIKAQEDEQRYIREAEAYAREREPIARGNAQRIIEEATGYKDQVVLVAQGEVERFQRLLPEFRLAPELLKERLYIQSMEKVMANTSKVMLDGNNGNNLTVLPLEQILRAKPETETEQHQTQMNSSTTLNSNNQNTVLSKPVSSTENHAATQQSNNIRKGRFN
ncbi:MAG TPA: FtsH protease activity modulator HflK [Pasteurellaceae bacterium]|nr:FtsH protease activity modulator HflK [Pasteurellaceae bacterium]